MRPDPRSRPVPRPVGYRQGSGAPLPPVLPEAVTVLSSDINAVTVLPVLPAEYT